MTWDKNLLGLSNSTHSLWGRSQIPRIETSRDKTITMEAVQIEDLPVQNHPSIRGFDKYVAGVTVYGFYDRRERRTYEKIKKSVYRKNRF